MLKKRIWGNCIVKNEDRYLWFAVKSAIDHLDKLLIWDTGSTDNTVKIIQNLRVEYPEKIIFQEIGEVTPSELTHARAKMLEQTNADWILLIDGDEVWWEKSIKEIEEVIKHDGDKLYAIVTPVINVVGDIYHYQGEDAGQYEILDKKGHFNIRAINKKIPGLHLKNDYPLEGFYDSKGTIIQEAGKEKLIFSKNPLMHFTHLVRSSSEESNNKVMQRKKKRKYEIGFSFPKDFSYPEALNLVPPPFIVSPWEKMPLSYKIRAFIETPLRKLKRKVRNRQ